MSEKTYTIELTQYELSAAKSLLSTPIKINDDYPEIAKQVFRIMENHRLSLMDKLNEIGEE